MSQDPSEFQDVLNRQSDSRSNKSANVARLPIWGLLAFPIALGSLLSLLVIAIQWTQEESGRLFLLGLDGLVWWASGTVVAALLLLLAVRFSMARSKSLMRLSVASMVTLASFLSLIRLEGFNGDRTPRFTWRWKPTAEQEARAYFISKRPRSDNSATLEDKRGAVYRNSGLLGPNRDGNVTMESLATDWQTSEPKLLWRHPVGLGWSSFAISGDATVTMEQRDENECVTCYDVRTGTERWCHSVPERFKNEYGDGPRSTPCIYDGKVIAMGATGILSCLDLHCGRVLWQHQVFGVPGMQNLLFGTTSSPLVVEGKVIVTPGAGKGAAASCYDLYSGDCVWSKGDDAASYASPTVSSFLGVEQILSFNGEGLRAYDLQGMELWLHPWVTQGESKVNVAQPVVVHVGAPANSNTSGWVLISSGYDRGTALIRVFRDFAQWRTEAVWTSHQLKSKLSNVIVHQGYVYGLDNGLLTCLSLKDGEKQWKRGRYGHGKLLLVNNLLFIQAESGEVVLVEANPTSYRELAKFSALESKTWNYPAIDGGILVVRNDHEAAAYELPN